jgi:tetratricopeptide (TPR) repeat protein
MIRMRFATKGILLTALVLVFLPARPAAARGLQQDQAKTSYTIPEYNAFQAARAETNAQNRIKLLDDFVTKFPTSTLMTYVDQLYVSTYTELKNYPKVLEYSDKLLAMGDKLDTGTRLQVLQTRVQVFPFAFNPKAPDVHDQLVKARDAAKEGADLLAKYPKPADSKLTDDQFAEQKKPGIAFFDAAAGFADLQLKDYPAAIDAFKGAVADNPKDAISYYREGLAYLGATPPQSVDGFWALARAINLGVPDADKIKDYLRKAILVYEQPGCDSSVDAQVGELLTLAGTSGDRPATYTIPAAADLQKIAASSTILTVLTDLGGGGDKANLRRTISRRRRQNHRSQARRGFRQLRSLHRCRRNRSAKCHHREYGRKSLDRCSACQHAQRSAGNCSARRHAFGQGRRHPLLRRHRQLRSVAVPAPLGSSESRSHDHPGESRNRQTSQGASQTVIICNNSQ